LGVLAVSLGAKALVDGANDFRFFAFWRLGNDGAKLFGSTFYLRFVLAR